MAECGPIKQIFWQGSRLLGVITVVFIVAFGFWALFSLTIPGAASPIEVLGVRPVQNCQAYVNDDYVVDCAVASCPAGCVRQGA